MSHTSSISAVKITNIDALRAAIAELNTKGVVCELIADAKPRAFYENQQGLGQAEFVLKLRDANYDVGFYKQPDGTYEARTDFWGSSVEKCLGVAPSKPERADQAKMGKLFQLYGVHVAMAEARRKGHSVRRIDMPNGKVKLEVTGASL